MQNLPAALNASFPARTAENAASKSFLLTQVAASRPTSKGDAGHHSCGTSSGSTPGGPRLVGIARLAQSSPRMRQRAGIQYFALPTRSALNRESSRRMPFAWTLNPYRGCEFGCKYCYARYTHEFMELHDGRDFERKIFAKTGSPDLLRAELRRARDGGLPIALGTATDPYQPAEMQFRITRAMLEVLGEFEGLDFSITTRSALILRDLDLLVPLARQNRLSVHITVTTLDARLARLIEPKAPPPLKRLQAVRELTTAGIRAGVNAAPILPGLTDSPAQLDRLAGAAAEHGSQFFFGNVLFLMPSAMAQFMPFLKKKYPQLVPRYRRLYRHSAYPPESYKRGIAALVDALRTRYGLDGKQEAATAHLHRQYALAFA